MTKREREKKLYQPRIKNHRVRQLYRLKQETGVAMTKLLDQALENYLAQMPKQRTAVTPSSNDSEVYTPIISGQHTAG